MGNGYNIETLTSVDVQENVENGSKVIKNCVAVIRPETFKLSLFRKIKENYLC